MLSLERIVDDLIEAYLFIKKKKEREEERQD
jgi:hypothetical protein